jgi:hypothetical protein
MYDPNPRRGPATQSEWWLAGVVLVGVVGLFAAEVCHDYTPVKLSALLVILFWMPLLVLHEAGHALVAHLLGWHVGQIVIGMGKTIGRFRIGTVDIGIRLIPIEGFVRCLPTKLRLPQLECALIFFAGPGVGLAVALIILSAVGPDDLLSASEDYGLIVWQSLALAATSQAILNLIPIAVRNLEGEMVSDGLGIILSLLRPTSYYAAMMGASDNEAQQDWEPPDAADWWKGDK